MAGALSWRVVGPLCVLLFPFLMLGADHGIPDGTWWDDGRDPAIWVTALIVAGAFAYGVAQLVAAPNAARERVRSDLEALARRAFVPINQHLPDVPINRLGVHIWTTDGDELKRLIKYTMEQQRVETPIRWRRGKGVIGVAWDAGSSLTADLTELYELAEAGGAAFDALEERFRYGLSRDEIRKGNQYKSISAYPLTGTNVDDVIGVLSVDCAVANQARQLDALSSDRTFQDVLGSCESALRRYLGR